MRKDSGPHQVLEECSHFAGEHGQVQEAGGQLMTVLGQVAIAQGLHGLSVLLLVLHMAWGGREGTPVLAPGWDWGRGCLARVGIRQAHSPRPEL